MNCHTLKKCQIFISQNLLEHRSLIQPRRIIHKILFNEIYPFLSFDELKASRYRVEFGYGAPTHLHQDGSRLYTSLMTQRLLQK